MLGLLLAGGALLRQIGTLGDGGFRSGDSYLLVLVAARVSVAVLMIFMVMSSD